MNNMILNLEISITVWKAWLADRNVFWQWNTLLNKMFTYKAEDYNENKIWYIYLLKLKR
jgi:hypothetical protein